MSFFASIEIAFGPLRVQRSGAGDAGADEGRRKLRLMVENASNERNCGNTRISRRKHGVHRRKSKPL